MFVLGIAPGAQALAYTVLAYERGRPRSELLDTDVLRAGRVTAKDALDIARRCRAHQLILDVVLERHPPAILVLGPPANPREPIEHVGLVRVALRLLAATFNVPVADLACFPDLYASLGVDTPRQLTSQVRALLDPSTVVPRDKRAFTSLAAAVAGTQNPALTG